MAGTTERSKSYAMDSLSRDLEDGKCIPHSSEIAEKVRATLQTRPIASKDMPTWTDGHVRVSGVICCPERWEASRNDPWFLGGKEIFQYIWNCFRPDPPRPECATKYDFTAWGAEFEGIVHWFKKKDMAKLPDDPLAALYAHLEI